MTKPLVSIALCTFNGVEFLKKQLDTIINQDYKNLEIIICDDLSKDGTKNILDKYSLEDNRIKLFYNNENLGYIKNFEKAIKNCSGEYIFLSDQDDIWELDKVSKMLNTFKEKTLL